MVAQTWRRVTFLHWPAEPRELGSRLPGGLTPEVIEGSAWISIVAFQVERFRVLGAVPGSWRSSFPETNLRTYVRHESGRDGVWFLSLDVPGWLNAIGGRLVGIPYHLSAMSVDANDGLIRYRSRRRAGRRPMLALDVWPGPPGHVDRADVATSLAGRWRAFTRVHRLLEVPVEHEPWDLQPARVERLHETLFAAAGVARPRVEPLVTFANRAHARLGHPRRPVPA